MNEKTIEWISPIPEPTIHRVLRILFLILMILFLVMFLVVSSFLPLIPLVAFAILFFVFYRNAYLEYSFIVVEDEVRIDVVYNKNRRRQKAHFMLTQVERMVHRVEDYDNPSFLCDQKDDKDKYTLVVNMGNRRSTLIIEPDPEFVELMKRKKIYM